MSAGPADPAGVAQQTRSSTRPHNPLRRRDFRVLWTAGLISDAGDWLLLSSLPIFVYQLTGSALGTSVAFLVELAPAILLGPLAGHLADRWDRRRLLVGLTLVQAVALLPLLAVHSRDDLPIAYTVIVIESALFTLFEPTKNAVVPSLVPEDQLVAGNSLIGLAMNLARLVGAPLGGALLAWRSLEPVVLVDAVSYLLGALLLVRLPRSARSGGTTAATNEAIPTVGEPPVAPVAALAATATPGFREVLSRTSVRAGLAVAGFIGAAQGLFVVLFVVFVAQVLHGDAAQTGLLRGVQAIGAIVAGLVLGTVGRAVAPGRLTAYSGAGFGLLCLAIWNAPLVTLAAGLYIVLFVLVGAPGVAMNTGLGSRLQQVVPDGVRGRVFAAMGVLFSAGQALGMVAAGLFADRLGSVALLNVQGLLYLVAGLVAAGWLTERSGDRRLKWRDDRR